MIAVAFYRGNGHVKANLVEQVKAACLEKGFFQITGHGISDDLQQAMMEQSKAFFALPLEHKEKYDQGTFLNTA